MKKIIAILSIIIETICLWIKCNLMYNIGVYVDENNTSPDNVYGSMFWLYGDWILLLLLIILMIVTIIQFALTFRN